jgi:hypothetical protein
MTRVLLRVLLFLSPVLALLLVFVVADPFGLTPAQSSNSLDFTEEGWKVYTPEELNIGKGGDTPDCPFDCNCCF